MSKIKLISTIVFLIYYSNIVNAQNLDKEMQTQIDLAIRQLDWAGLARYQEENKKLNLKDSISPDVIFMGDSITEGWSFYSPIFFSSNNYLNRGIGGQTTSQMLIRFRKDVIKLKPKIVVILAGINDIAQNTKYYGINTIAENIFSMVELATANNITPIICSILPADRFEWRPEMLPLESVKKLNALLYDYAEKENIIFLDYYSFMKNEKGGMKDELTTDGVHVTKEGYNLMSELAKKIIHETLMKL